MRLPSATIEPAMAYVVNCECGYVARGETLDDVVEETTEHLRSDHPDLAEAVTRTDIESWAQLAP
jgi:predicted small metal-binding protein